MIAKITSGHSTRHLIAYLYGPGRSNEHTDPHLVASWDGFAPDPGRDDNPRAAKRQLAQALDLRVHQAQRQGRNTGKHVWHCSLRAAPEDRVLSDEEWADIARRVLHTTGIAPEGDADGCRWIAVWHAQDHIHLAATTVRGDLRNEKHWNDYLHADRELAAVEKDYGLTRVVRGDRTAAKRPTRPEREKAQRTGRARTSREHLRTVVRTAVAAATSPSEFLDLLENVDGILLQVQRFPSGDVRGYKIALDGDTNAAGQPVWFSGSTLAPDLSYPKIRQRLDTEPSAGRRIVSPWEQATEALERLPHDLDRDEEVVAQARIAALGETLDALHMTTPPEVRADLRQAADTFARATRSRLRAEHHHTRAMRHAVRTLLRQPAPKDGTGLSMLLDAALLAVIAAARWHDRRQHQQQAEAARQTLQHLHAAYDHAAATPLADLASHSPPPHAQDRHAARLREALPQHADHVLASPDWNALAAVLNQAEIAGHDAALLLQRVADQRALDDAHSPAKVLVWRIRRLSQHPAASPRAKAAQARSTAHAPRQTPPPLPTRPPDLSHDPVSVVRRRR